MPKSDPPIDRVRAIVAKLPDVGEGTTFGYSAFKVHDKTFAWFPKKKEVEDGSLAVRMSFDERDRRVAQKPDAYYVTPHYEHYTSILARTWELTDAQLKELVASGHAFMTGGTTPVSPRRADAKKRR